MPFDPNVTFEQAEKSRTQKLSIARERRAPDPLGVIQEASRRHTYHIFNVGPWPQKINTGSTGWVLVPGCPKNKSYVEALVQLPEDPTGERRELGFPGIIQETYIKDEYRLERMMYDGWVHVQEVCGIGRNRNPKQALTNYGLFPSKNEVPTKEELARAKLLLHATCSEIVREARDLYAMDRKAFSVVVNRNRHFAAAEVLNLADEVWMTEQSPSQRIKCKYCGSMNDEIAVLCQKCSHIINAERYRELQEEEQAVMGTHPEDPPKRGPGRPRREPEA